MGIALFAQAIASILIAISLGYIAFVLASKEKGALKGWGYFVGGLVFVLSIFLLANIIITSVLVSRQISRSARPFSEPKQAPAPIKPITPAPAP
jgi:hypothetical protein